MSDHERDSSDPRRDDAAPGDVLPNEMTPRGGGDEHVAGVDAFEPAGYDLAGAALDALDPAESAELEAAVARDPALREMLDDVRATVAELGALAPPASVNRGRSAGIRSRLVARAASSREGRPPGRGATLVDLALPAGGGVRAAEPGAAGSDAPGRRAGSPHSSPVQGGQVRTGTVRRGVRPAEHKQGREGGRHGGRHRGPAVLGSLALAASLAFVATGIQLLRVTRERDALRSLAGSQATTMSSRVATLESALASRDSLVATLTGPQTRVIDMVNYTAQGPEARMFWDQRTQQWMMFAHHLEQPSAGKTYQLWLIARGHPTPISAGTFRPRQDGSAVMHARYDMPPGTLRRVAVTEEPMGGVPFPTGRVVIAGAGR